MVDLLPGIYLIHCGLWYDSQDVLTSIRNTEGHISAQIYGRTDMPIMPLREERHVCQCSIFYKIRECNHVLSKQGLGPLLRLMEYEKQRFLVLFSPEVKNYRKKLLTVNSTSTVIHQHRTVFLYFYDLFLFHKSTKENKEVTIYQAIRICYMRQWTMTLSTCHRQIKAIINISYN
jgi:hypothetical protein